MNIFLGGGPDLLMLTRAIDRAGDYECNDEKGAHNEDE
jgi:hypothetical protein